MRYFLRILSLIIDKTLLVSFLKNWVYRLLKAGQQNQSILTSKFWLIVLENNEVNNQWKSSHGTMFLALLAFQFSDPKCKKDKIMAKPSKSMQLSTEILLKKSKWWFGKNWAWLSRKSIILFLLFGFSGPLGFPSKQHNVWFLIKVFSSVGRDCDRIYPVRRFREIESFFSIIILNVILMKVSYSVF